MKKLVSKPTLVLMAGLPGVGKSTLAHALGLDLGWVVFDRDSFKDSLLEDVMLNKTMGEDTAGRAAYEVFFGQAQDLLVNQHQSIILDTSTLHRFIFNRARELASMAEAEFKVILCEVDERTRQHRLRTRKKRISQAHGHLVPEEAARQFDTLPPELTLKIDTKVPLKKYEGKALAFISGTKLLISSTASTKSDASHESPIARLVKIF